MQKKNRNRDSLITNSLNKNYHSKEKKKARESVRCQSQNAHRVEDNLGKKIQCKSHRNELTNLYHTLQFDKNEKMEELYRRSVEEMNLHENKINFHQFVSIIARMRKYLNKRTNYSEESLQKTWKTLAKNENKIS